MSSVQSPGDNPASTRPETQPERIARLTGQRVGLGFVAFYITAMVGLWVALLTPSSITLALRVAAIDPESKASSLAVVTGTGAVFALAANPIFGHFSDVSTSRWGQRRPYILGGAALGIASLVIVGLAPNILVVTIGWCLTQVCFNAALAAMISLLPERIPEDRRGKTSGLMGITNQVANTIGSYIVVFTGTGGLGMFLVPGAVSMVVVLSFVLFLREVPKSREELPPKSWKDVFASFWINPIKHSDFGWAFVSRFLMYTATALLTTYKAYFLIDRLGYTDTEAAGIVAWSMIINATGTIIGSVVCGWWSDRVNRRRVFVGGAAFVFGIGMLVLAGSFSLWGFAIGVGIAGLGAGAYAGVDYALMANVLPDGESEAAKGMGVFNIANSLPQTTGPMMAPFLLAFGGGENYAALYIGATGFAATAAIVIRFIRSSP